jgi:hypothetical protein
VVTKRSTSAPTPTIQQILGCARHAHLADATIQVTLDSSSAGRDLTGTGTIKFTRQPERIDTTLTLSSGSTSFAVTSEEIADAATKTTYINVSSPPLLVTDGWKKAGTEATGSDIASFDRVLAYDNLTHPHLVGATTSQGIAVWQIRGVTTEAAEAAAQATTDVYLRRDTCLPVRTVLTLSGESTSTITYQYTAVNTGLVIQIPTISGT